VTFYVIDKGVISEEDLCKIQNRPLPEQIEIYTLLARSCQGAAKQNAQRWRDRDQQRPHTFCGMQTLAITREGEMWQRKAQEAQEAQRERFLERCFDISAGDYGSIGLAALVESRFQRG
jgi:hypothetical protein